MFAGVIDISRKMENIHPTKAVVAELRTTRVVNKNAKDRQRRREMVILKVPHSFSLMDDRYLVKQAPGKKKVATKNRDMKKRMLMMMVGEDRITQHLW